MRTHKIHQGMEINRLHKLLCPAWKWHVSKSWKLEPFKRYWFCKWCPLPNFNSLSSAYRITLGETE